MKYKTRQELNDLILRTDKKPIRVIGEDLDITGTIISYNTEKANVTLNTKDGSTGFYTNAITQVEVDSKVYALKGNKILPHKASGGYEVYFEGHYAGLAHSRKEAKQLLRTCKRIKKIYG